MKLFVGGCSFSSSLKVERDESWPNLVSKKLGITLIDESSVAGSNYRIWRKAMQHIREGTLQPTDTVIIQYTEPHREEIFSPVKRPPDHISLSENDSRNAPAEHFGKEGYLIKYKWGLDIGSGIGEEKALARMKYKFSCEAWDLERFKFTHEMFQGFLLSRKFKKVYFMLGGYYSPDLTGLVDPRYKIIDCRYELKNHAAGDPHHLNKMGHQKVAQTVLNLI